MQMNTLMYGMLSRSMYVEDKWSQWSFIRSKLVNLQLLGLFPAVYTVQAYCIGFEAICAPMVEHACWLWIEVCKITSRPMIQYLDCLSAVACRSCTVYTCAQSHLRYIAISRRTHLLWTPVVQSMACIASVSEVSPAISGRFSVLFESINRPKRKVFRGFRKNNQMTEKNCLHSIFCIK